MHAVDVAPQSAWPEQADTRVPYQVFVDPAIYEREQERIFRGPVWNYVGLEAELPEPGDFKASFIGDTPIVVTRGKDGRLHAFVNRCAHRGSLVCRELRGNRMTHTCVYHQWSYNLEGDLIGVPFRKGIEGKGGYGADFDPGQHALHKLTIDSYQGLIFVSFARELRAIRLKQANFVGPAGLISMEDGHATEIVQQAIVRDRDAASYIAFGGNGVENQDNLLTETAIRGFWQYYRGVMGFAA